MMELHQSVLRSSHVAMTLLRPFKFGCGINTVYKNECTPLYVAVQDGQFEAILILLARVLIYMSRIIGELLHCILLLHTLGANIEAIASTHGTPAN